MKRYNDFRTDGERLEYIKGILEATQKSIRSIRDDHTEGYISSVTEEDMIENEKVCAYNYIEEFLEED